MSEQLPLHVHFRDVSHRYGSHENSVLERIELAVNEGEFVSLIGPSGCGKSTLLKLIAGLQTPTQGDVLIHGRPPTEARGEQAFVFQDPTLLPWLNVRKNVELPMRLQGIPAATRKTLALERLQLVGLGGVPQKYPRELSGGMRMRASIARALSLAPRVLLLDEPFGALDAMTRNRLNEDLLAIRRHENWTAFFVTHSVNEAVFLSSRILVLSINPGRICADIPVHFTSERNGLLRHQAEFHEKVREVSEVLLQKGEVR